MKPLLLILAMVGMLAACERAPSGAQRQGSANEGKAAQSAAGGSSNEGKAAQSAAGR